MIVLQLQTKQMKRKVKRKVLDYIPTFLSIKNKIGKKSERQNNSISKKTHKNRIFNDNEKESKL